MKGTMILLMAVCLSSCEVCRECETTYYDNNGVGVVTETDEVCGTNREVKEKEGIHYVNGVKTSVKCK